MSRLPAALALTLLVALPAAAQEVEPLAPDPSTQEQIGEVVEGTILANRGEAPADLKRKSSMLLREHDDRRVFLVQQILFYRAANPGNEPAMATSKMIHFYNFTPEVKISAAVPLLESEDGWVRDSAAELLTSMDQRGQGDPDFSHYVPILRTGRYDPTGLLRYMYRISPKSALAATTEAYHGPDHVAATTKKATVLGRYAQLNHELAPVRLEEMSKDPAWWVRLYAVYVTRVYPDLAPQVAERLAGDPHRQVRTVFE